MSILKNLKFSDVVKSNVSSAEDATRAKFIKALNVQMDYVKAIVANEPFVVTKRVGGEEKAKRFAPWSFKEKGTFYTSLKYGNTVLFVEGKGSIEAGPTMESLLKIYEEVVRATHAGELDKLLTAAAAKRTKKAAKPASKPTK